MEIYLITNQINGKQYVGLTTRTSEERFKEHLCGNQFVDKAIQKYGSNNFTLEILCKPKTIESLMEKESYWADKLNTYYPNGYNIAKCGTVFGQVDNEIKYVLAAKKSFEEFIDVCFEQQYALTSHSNPIKIWVPPFKSVLDDITYYPICGEERVYRSVNKAVRDLLFLEYGTFYMSRDMILKSINEKIPVEAKLFDKYFGYTIACDKNGLPIHSVWYCASSMSRDEYKEYLNENKPKIIDKNIESYRCLYNLYRNKTYDEISEYVKRRKDPKENIVSKEKKKKENKKIKKSKKIQ